MGIANPQSFTEQLGVCNVCGGVKHGHIHLPERDSDSCVYWDMVVNQGHVYGARFVDNFCVYNDDPMNWVGIDDIWRFG